ncbi:hypothetical protein [Aliikangiella maris]|uniref:Uncharacterized protein n=2 Tax=Aliikangiella maris TaxID=3162458 RepID=A0ABV2BUL5_9GAMM
MIKLKNIEGKVSLSIEVVGYQFPESEKDDWCLLKVQVEQDNDSIELIDPAIETTELAQLLLWVSSLSEGRLPRYAHLTFIEPCISFNFLSFKDDIVRISITLSHELKPNFPLIQFGNESSEWCIVFELNENQFTNIRNGIKSTLERYPIRGS